jgi:DNA-binding NarL/FixJ family response regulator
VTPSDPAKDLLFPRERLDAIGTASAALRSRREALIESLRDQLTRLRLQRDLLAEAQAMRRRPHGSSETSSIATRYGLTPREAEVALLLAAGRGNAAIASKLRISPHTARHHTQHVLAKLGVHSRSAAGARLRHLA